MIQVELIKIIIDEKRQDQIIVLKEKQGDRQFPIVIGFLEASSIKMKLSNVEPPRPMTHDLLYGAITSLNASMEYLLIDKMISNTFHAKLVLRDSSKKEIFVDCRPSDGIAAAVRFEAPIYVDEKVIEQASIFKNL